MNIFRPYHEPQDCASALDDRRVIKMVLETAQMLSTAARTFDFRLTYEDEGVKKNVADVLYKSTHTGHPCTVWAQEPDEWLWLHALFTYLCDEYMLRFGDAKGKRHLCEVKLKDPLWHFAIVLADSGADMRKAIMSPNCTPYKDMPVLDAYRLTLREKWNADNITPKWTNRERPTWA